MTKASDNIFPRLLVSEGGSTTTPASGNVTVYAKADGLLYQKDDAGTETLLAGAAAPGAVATDAIWDAAGDLAVGSGADTAARLAAGTEGHVLTIASGVPAWAAAAGGGGIANPLDDITLHGTYGDHFTAVSGLWTGQNRVTDYDQFGYHGASATWAEMLIPDTTNFGDLQAFTDKDEFDIEMAGSYYSDALDDGFGPIVLDSAGTGVWFGFRASSRLGIFAVTTYTTATEPVNSLGTDGAELYGYGLKGWWRLSKRKTGASGDVYWWQFSINGATWSAPMMGYVPTAFTPAKIGWYQGVQNVAGAKLRIALDWFNVANDKSIGNNLLITPTSGTVTPTTNATSPSGSLANTLDGAVDGNEWYFGSANASGTYALYTWSVAQTINRVRINTRSDAWGLGYVELSDGSKYPVHLVGSNAWHYVDIPGAGTSTTYVKVVWLKQTYGSNPGLKEVEAYLAS
ncbi:MAG TPA: hypothetical protein VMW94_01270 [Actinomycetes bacterium]|nr:hypothetical protein [Actinomycetes bacterium]